MSAPLFVLTGPSGAGKSTILDRMILHPPFPFERLVTMTTRQPRLGEVSGRDYLFVSRDAFEKDIAAGNFFEWAEVYGHYYGSNKNELLRLQAGTKPIVLTLDVQGAMTIKRTYPESCVIFIDAPRENLLERTSKRNMGAAETERRVQRIEAESMFKAEADVVIMNKDGELDAAASRVAEEIKGRI